MNGGIFFQFHALSDFEFLKPISRLSSNWNIYINSRFQIPPAIKKNFNWWFHFTSTQSSSSSSSAYAALYSCFFSFLRAILWEMSIKNINKTSSSHWRSLQPSPWFLDVYVLRTTRWWLERWRRRSKGKKKRKEENKVFMARLASTIDEKESQIVLNYVFFSGGQRERASLRLPCVRFSHSHDLLSRHRESLNEIRLIKFGSSF